jgi:hypothetical protein
MLGDGGGEARDILGEVSERRRRGQWGAAARGRDGGGRGASSRETGRRERGTRGGSGRTAGFR